jgi:putative colanic acid biosynthesis glycosyltransferase
MLLSLKNGAHKQRCSNHNYSSNRAIRNMPSKNLISIITVVKNGKNFIERSILSVINQDYQNIEYIIIDGGSIDGTVEVIKKYDRKISYWISETDKGIYDAMNKGINASNGDWILFLGCDDYLIDDRSINKLAAHISDDLQMIFGGVICSNGYHFKSVLNAKTLIVNTVHHQGCIYNSALFKNFSYDIDTMVYGDYELNLIVFLRKYKFHCVNEIISFFELGGASSSNEKSILEEVNYVRGKHLNSIANTLFSQIYNILVYILPFKQMIRRIRGKYLRV